MAWFLWYFTVLAASSALADAVRLSPRVPEAKSASGSALTVVPELNQIRSMWDCYMAKEDTGVPTGKLPTMVLGVFSTLRPEDRPYRDMIRTTWMQQPLVCSVVDSKKSTCKVFVAFVVGRSGNFSIDADEEDLVVLPSEENMNCGKTREWFHTASNKYSWASHVAKMDMDAFLHVSTLLKVLRDFPSSCPHVFGGRSWSCFDSSEWCPPDGCYGHYPKNHDFFSYDFTPKGKDARCWSYMQGGFYFMSQQLAAAISEEKGWWDRYSRETCHPEDSVAGQAVTRYGLENNLCVAAADIKDSGVMWHPENSSLKAWRKKGLPCTLPY